MPDEPRRILVVKLADLGDLLVSEPALRSLRTAFPAAQIDVAVPPSTVPLLPLIGGRLRAVAFPKHLFDRPAAVLQPRRAALAARFAARLRLARYDTVVILHHLTTPAGTLKFRWLARATGATTVAGLDNGRGAFLTKRVHDLGFGACHESQYMLAVARAAGGAAVDAAPRIETSALPPVDGLPSRYALLYPATGPYSPARTWAAHRFASVAREVAARGVVPVVVGASDAQDAARTIVDAEPTTVNLVGATDLPQLAAVVASAAVVVGGDSFIGHLAAALDRPRVTLFGPSNRDAWRPWGSVDANVAASSQTPRGIVVYHDLPCEPCVYTGFRLGRPDGCPARTCMERLAVEDVVRAIDLAIGGS